jgi:hypothetical protein
MAIPKEWTLYKFRLERYLRFPAVKQLCNQSKINLMRATMGKTADSTYSIAPRAILSRAAQPKTSNASSVDALVTGPDSDAASLRRSATVTRKKPKGGHGKSMESTITAAEPCEETLSEDEIYFAV